MFIYHKNMVNYFYVFLFWAEKEIAFILVWCVIPKS